jgi:hypothetical protein
MSDMAHLLRAKELNSFVVYSSRTYDYAENTDVDIFWTADHIRNFLFHYLLMGKL